MSIDLKKNSTRVVRTFEFDNYASRRPSQILVVENGEETEIVLNRQSLETVTLLNVERDQWGVFYMINPAQVSPLVAQEDNTRSMLDALIKALKYVRDNNEHMTKPATKVK